MKYHAIPNSPFIETPKDKKDYVFGGLRNLGVNEILVENGQWDEYQPIFEGQRNLMFDPWACTNFAFTNDLEFIHKRRYGDENNQSDRFSALISNTVPRQGNNIKAPAEACRLKGSVKQEAMPYPQTMTESEFYKHSDLTPEMMKLGEEFLAEYDFGYERIQKYGKVMDKEKAMEALKYSPLQTAIDSSTKSTANFRGWNDSVVIYGYEIGKYWKVFGSYLQTTGEFDWDYPFYVPNKYHLKKKLILNLENNMLKLVRNQENGKIYLQDSDLVLHWVETESDFKRLLGEIAWVNKDWTDLSSNELNKFVEGVSLSARKIDFIQTLKTLLNNLGFKK